MKRLLSCFFVYLFYHVVMAQGYLCKKGYVSTEVMHPVADAINFQVNVGKLINRYYALEWQLAYNHKYINLYNYYQIALLGFINGKHEYLMGKVACDGLSTRLTFRTFNRASKKAAPVGWYVNYGVEYQKMMFKGTLETLKATGFNSYGNFNVIKNNMDFDQSISIYAFRIAPGKSILLSSKYFVDFGIELGMRWYQFDDTKWINNDKGIYWIESLFQNKLNKYYLYHDNREYVKNNYLDLIYEPTIKIGFLF